jgi:sugar transferase (PEP-CTERM system associated)
MYIFGIFFNRLAISIFLIEFLIFASVFWTAYTSMAAAAGYADNEVVVMSLLSALTLALTASAIGAYRHEARRVSLLTVQRFAIGALAAFVLLTIATIFSGEWMHVLPWPWLAGVLTGAVLTAMAFRVVGQRLLFVGESLKPRALVLGTGELAGTVAQAITEHRGTRLVGFAAVDGDDAGDVVPPWDVVAFEGDLAAVAKAHKATEIVVAVENRRGRLPIECLLRCRMQGIDVIEAPSFLERETGRVDIEALRPSWLIFSNGFASDVVYSVTKRGCDLAGAVLGLVLTAPLMALVALAVRLETPGPVLYTQKRVGRLGRPFTIFKFRSMYVDAERRGQARWATKDDPRITRVGRILRRTRLDELPQLFNVLRGDMSFIGPRPERPEFVDRLAAQIPYYNERHRIRPGLTGWAQINYRYSDSFESSKEKLCYDLYYLKNRSLFLDLVITQQTMRILISGEGAH